MISTLSLTGKQTNNRLNLFGKDISNEQPILSSIKRIKILILNKLILPLISKQWSVLNENLICLDKIKKKLDYYYDIYKLDDLVIYKEILKAFELIIGEHQQLEYLEKKIYTDQNNSSNMNFSTLVYKTTMIRLKPEYELYDLILGKPDKKLNQKYNGEIISCIEKLLLIDDISFNKIKEIIIKKYCD
jgi:hypothetical protein